MKYIMGINFAYHDLSVCIIKDGKLLIAVEEERFSRIKHAKKALINNPDVLPKKALQYCLQFAGISFGDIDQIGLSFFPNDRLQNINIDPYFVDGGWGSEKGEKAFYKKIQRIPILLNKLGNFDLDEKIIWIPHHICHASSAFFVSPFKESAILSIDGIGEFSSTWLGYGKDNNLHAIKEFFYPHSIGFLWEKISKYLGFTEYDSSKIMGLAAYGNAKHFYKKFQNIVKLYPNGEFTIDNSIMQFRLDGFDSLEKLFGVKKINIVKEITKEQADIAAALQKITNDVVIHLVKFLKDKTRSKNLCLAGGVALNCVSNAAIMRSSLYKNIYIQPAANDAGTALGAAYYIWHQRLNHKKRKFIMNHAYWGPCYSDGQVESILDQAEVIYYKSKNIAKDVAQKLAEHNIVGWFHGKSEWGPRALGNRSLLADPRMADMKNILNLRIKKRESFRPFAPSILIEHKNNWLVIPKHCKSISAEFMEINFYIKKSKQKQIPAVVHVDGTSRVQFVNKKINPLYHRLISYFYEFTGVPLLLNTSFNEDEPIVCSPEDAVKTFLRTQMDYLAIGNYLVSKK